MHVPVTSAFPQPDEVLDQCRVERRSRELVHDALDRLQPRDREIVERRHLAEQPETLAAVGRSLGISRERVRQLHVRARSQLRTLVEEMQRDAEELARAG